MEVLLCWTIGILVAISVYLILDKNLMRTLFGIMLLGTAINLLIFVVGRLTKFVPPFIADHNTVAPSTYANALPQALILTAIVIGFGVVTYALVLITKAWGDFGTVNSDELRLAEPEEDIHDAK